jgi:tRNA(Ile)-lysidine synthase
VFPHLRSQTESEVDRTCFRSGKIEPMIRTNIPVNRVNKFLQRVENEIQNRRLLARGQKTLVAVSGGLDSMTLLHVLEKLSTQRQWRLVVAHFNHQLRGRASDADERLVRKTAAALKWPIVVGRADVQSFAKKSKISVEMAARKLRHEFLAQAARKWKIKTIALAHHADDQVELFFLRLFRGAGGEGLAGMKWHSPSPADPKITLVRPLLDCSKADLLAFAQDNKIRFRHDATNSSTDYLRNRIRNELLPRLRKNYQPALDKTVLRLMEITGAESDCAGEAARIWLEAGRAGLPVSPDAPQRVPTGSDFGRLPVAVQRRVVLSQLVNLGVTADFELIESLRRVPDVFVSTGANMSVRRNQSGEIKLRTEMEPGNIAGELAVILSGQTGAAVFAGVSVDWRVQKQRQFRQPVKKPAGGPPALREWFDADKVGGKIVLRHWRPGDRFQPIGLKSAAKLQDLFVNAKIPRERRRELALAATARGEIFWVEGLRIGEQFKLTAQTARTLVWKWSNLPCN